MGPWEQFFIQKLDDGKYAIRTAHNTYLRAHPGAGAKVDLHTFVSINANILKPLENYRQKLDWLDFPGTEGGRRGLLKAVGLSKLDI